MSRWVEELGPVSVQIGCGGAIHRVEWRRGKVVLRDHVVREEEALLALGGDPPPCVAVLVEWRDRAGWDAALRPHPPGFVRRARAPAIPAPLADVRRLAVFRRWDRAWSRRSGDADEAEDLYRHLRREALPRLRDALEAARSRLGGGPVSYVEVRLARFHRPATVTGRVDANRSSIVATLRPEWLYTVGAAPMRDPEPFPLDVETVVWWREAAGGWEAYAS